MKEAGKGPAILRLNNEKRVMAALRHLRVTSRQDLSRQLKLSKNTVSLIIDDFIAAGVVEERGPVAAVAAGRRKIEIALRPERRKTAGIMVVRQRIHVRVCNYFAEVLEEKSWQTDTSDPQSVLAELGACCQQLAAAHPTLLGIGIGFPGIVDPQRGWMHLSSHLGWQDVDLRTPLQAMVNLPLIIMNHVKAAALLSVQQLKLDTSRSCFYLRVAEGTGGALVQNGEVFTGSSWTAGEAGHLTVLENGPRCTCGRQGCLEVLISQPVIQREFEHLAPGLSWQEREQAPEVLDPLMAQAGSWLGGALGQIMLLLNPASIVVDCPWNSHPGFIEAARKAAASSTLTFTALHTQLNFPTTHIDPTNGLALAVIEYAEKRIE